MRSACGTLFVMDDKQAMRKALELAQCAAAAGDVPVGAVVLDASGAVIGTGYNTREAHNDPLAHAEILAMRQAAEYRASVTSVVASATSAAHPSVSSVAGPSVPKPSAAAAPSATIDSAAAKIPTAVEPSTTIGSPVIGSSAANSPVALQLASSHPTTAWNLADCTLVVTLEPCPMCAGACLQTHIGRIVFGAWDAKLGACGSVWDIPRDPHIGHAPEVYGGVMERESVKLLADFFATRR